MHTSHHNQQTSNSTHRIESPRIESRTEQSRLRLQCPFTSRSRNSSGSASRRPSRAVCCDRWLRYHSINYRWLKRGLESRFVDRNRRRSVTKNIPPGNSPGSGSEQRSNGLDSSRCRKQRTVCKSRREDSPLRKASPSWSTTSKSRGVDSDSQEREVVGTDSRRTARDFRGTFTPRHDWTEVSACDIAAIASLPRFGGNRTLRFPNVVRLDVIYRLGEDVQSTGLVFGIKRVALVEIQELVAKLYYFFVSPNISACGKS